MKVEMTTEVNGPLGTWRSGEVHDLPPEIAKARIEAGEARAVAQTRAQRRETRTSQRPAESR